MPSVIVECLEVIVFLDPDRVKVAADWFLEIGLPVQIGLLDAAFQNSFLVVEGIGTFPVGASSLLLQNPRGALDLLGTAT